MAKTEVAPEIIKMFEEVVDRLSLFDSKMTQEDLKVGDIVSSPLLTGLYIIDSFKDNRACIKDLHPDTSIEVLFPILPKYLLKANKNTVSVLFGDTNEEVD